MINLPAFALWIPITISPFHHPSKEQITALVLLVYRIGLIIDQRLCVIPTEENISPRIDVGHA